MSIINQVEINGVLYDIEDKALKENLDSREAVADLLAVADLGSDCRRIVYCNASTANTPYKASLTDFSKGVAIVSASDTDRATILYIPAGSPKIFVNRKAPLYPDWSGWESIPKIKHLVVTAADLPAVGSREENTFYFVKK